jgi:hypothetical protein
MLGGLRKSLSRQCCQRFAKVAASAKRAPGLLLGHACELDRTPFRRGDGPTTRQIEAAAGGALPPEDLPATALPAGPDGLLFVGFVDRPRLFAFCRTAPELVVEESAIPLSGPMASGC